MRKAAVLFGVFALLACDVGGPQKLNEKLVCTGNDAGFGSFELRLSDAQAKEWGEAFAATGNCDAVIKQSTFVSPGVALRASGNTKLVFEGGHIEGNPALDLSGNAKVELKGTTLVGDVKTSGNAKVIGLEEK